MSAQLSAGESAGGNADDLGDVVKPPPPATTAEEAANPFVCNVCKRSYSRLDHLARHHRSHTREKPFTCLHCGKSFARADLLKRHTLGHSNHDTRQGPGAWRRRSDSLSQPYSRVAQACALCASSKMKCGDEKPCRRCRSKGIECKYPSSEKSGYQPSITSLPEKSIKIPSTEIASNNSMTTAAPAISLDERQQDLSQTRDEQSYQKASSKNFPNNELEEERNINQYLDLDGMDLSDPPGPSEQLNDQSMEDFDDSSLAEFLRDIMMPNSSQSPNGDTSVDYEFQPYPFRDVFDFGLNTSLDFTDIDLDWITTYDSQVPFPMVNGIPNESQGLNRGQKTPDIRNGFNLGAQAFQNSLWRWAPARGDHGYAEQGNLSLPTRDMEVLERNVSEDPLEQHIERVVRDQILVMLIGTCQPTVVAKTVASFPSSQTLNHLMHQFFQTQLGQTDSWIHVPTFQPSVQCPELNGIIVAAGAVLSNVPAVRKLGYAMEEAVRLAIPKKFESDNSLTRDLQLLQAYAVQLSIGFWSGNKRKMEIAESFAHPLVTMLRRAGRYRRERVPPLAPKLEDSNEVLQGKWLRWVRSESFKRLAFHTLIHDAQTSVALLVRPSVIYTEVSLELPCSKSLWLAKDCYTWREVYLQNFPGQDNRLPSLMNCIYNSGLLESVQLVTDLHMSTSLILHATWSLIAEYRQLEHVMRLQASSGSHGNGGLISTSWHQELCQHLTHLRLTMTELDCGMLPESVMILELFMMNLHVSFEDLQLFAGKEGNEEAQRVYPLLRTWKESQKSRQAIWHAGQIVRAALTCHPSRLQSLCAITLYHASLAFWTYGMITLGSSRSENPRISTEQTVVDSELIWLDGEETAESRRFVAIQRGVPVIHDLSVPATGNNGIGFIKLCNPKAVMDGVIMILSRQNRGEGGSPSPLVENLGQLMRDLGNAAAAIGCS